MIKSFSLVLLFSLVIIAGCSNDDPVTPPPASGEVLLAEIPSDSVGVQSGSASITRSITSGMLDFTDRDSVRISFYYSSSVSNTSVPITIFYTNGTNSDTVLYSRYLPTGLKDQFVDAMVRSLKVNEFFQYRISASSGGFSYFKFRDLKIYKK